MGSVRLGTGRRDRDQSLLRWLHAVPELRGHVEPPATPPAPGELGAGGQVVVALMSAGAATALMTSIQVWLANRHSDVSVTVTAPDGRQVTVQASRLHDVRAVDALLRAALETTDTEADAGQR